MEEARKSISEHVREAIETLPYLKHGLSEGVVNYSALARKLNKDLSEKTGRKINEESLVVAIKRYADEIGRREMSENVAELLAKSSISMQDDVSYALFHRADEVTESLQELINEVHWHFGEMRVIVQGAGKVFILLKKERMEGLLEKIDEHLVEMQKDYAMVSISTPKEAIITYGILNEMTSALAKKGVSIEIVSVPPELHFLVKSGDAEKTYRILKEIIQNAKDNIEGNSSD